MRNVILFTVFSFLLSFNLLGQTTPNGLNFISSFYRGELLVNNYFFSKPQSFPVYRFSESKYFPVTRLNESLISSNTFYPNFNTLRFQFPQGAVFCRMENETTKRCGFMFSIHAAGYTE